MPLKQGKFYRGRLDLQSYPPTINRYKPHFHGCITNVKLSFTPDEELELERVGILVILEGLKIRHRYLYIGEMSRE